MPSHGIRAGLILLFALPLWACTGSGDDSSVSAASQPSAPADGSVPAPRLDCAPDSGDWPMYGQNVCNTRTAAAGDPITPKTVSKLKVKWTFTAAGDISATPAVVGGQLYVPDWGGMLQSHRCEERAVVWSKDVAISWD